MPDKVLLLGGAGTVGSRVGHALLDAGYSLRCLGRSKGNRSLAELQSRGSELLYGDMNDEEALKRALEGCRYFVHSAAPYPWSGLHSRLAGYLQTWPGQLKRQFELAKQAGIERAVYTSSLSTIGQAAPGKLADETLPFDPVRQSGGNYYPVKAALEKAVLEATTGAAPVGPPTVIVNPTGLVGEGSRNVHLSAVCVFYQGLSPFMVDARMSFVDCHDVGRGHVLALQKGKPGERYILGGCNTTLREFAEKIAALAKRRRPAIVPRWLAHWAAQASEWWGLLTGKLGALSLTSYYHLQYGQHYSWDKAKRELGYEPADDLEAAILRELRWHGVIPSSERGVRSVESQAS